MSRTFASPDRRRSSAPRWRGSGSGTIRGKSGRDDSIRRPEETSMDLGIQGRTAIVTGGARGIGRETARRLLEAGARVTICARTKATLEQARDELAVKTGGEVLAGVADMAGAPRAQGGPAAAAPPRRPPPHPSTT